MLFSKKKKPKRYPDIQGTFLSVHKADNKRVEYK